MESCARVAARLPEYVADELTRATEGRLAEHLTDCADCRKRAAGHLFVLDALRTLPQVAPPVDLRGAVMQRILSNPLPSPGRASRGRLRIVRTLLWTTPLMLLGAVGGAGAALVFGRGWDRPGVLDPTILPDWVENLGRLAFSFLLDVATRTELPFLPSSPSTSIPWQGLALLVALALAVLGLAGLGLLMTARVLAGAADR
jgi:putative zinc finger protein